MISEIKETNENSTDGDEINLSGKENILSLLEIYSMKHFWQVEPFNAF